MVRVLLTTLTTPCCICVASAYLPIFRYTWLVNGRCSSVSLCCRHNCAVVQRIVMCIVTTAQLCTTQQSLCDTKRFEAIRKSCKTPSVCGEASMYDAEYFLRCVGTNRLSASLLLYFNIIVDDEILCERERLI